MFDYNSPPHCRVEPNVNLEDALSYIYGFTSFYLVPMAPIPVLFPWWWYLVWWMLGWVEVKPGSSVLPSCLPWCRYLNRTLVEWNVSLLHSGCEFKKENIWSINHTIITAHHLFFFFFFFFFEVIVWNQRWLFGLLGIFLSDFLREQSSPPQKKKLRHQNITDDFT